MDYWYDGMWLWMPNSLADLFLDNSIIFIHILVKQELKELDCRYTYIEYSVFVIYQDDKDMCVASSNS